MARSISRSARLFALGALLFCQYAAHALIETPGLTNHVVYKDVVTFQVVAPSEFDTVALLDDAPILTGVSHHVDRIGYHDLEIHQTNRLSKATESRFIQFIIKSSERADSEWGLAPWTPLGLVQGAPEEFSGAGLRVTAPSSYPEGMEIPIVAWVTNQAGRVVRSHGLLSTALGNPIQLRRGVGSGYLPPTLVPGEQPLRLELHGLVWTQTVTVEPAAAWKDVSGTLVSNALWSTGERIRLVGSLEIVPGVELRIEPNVVVQCLPNSEIRLGGRLIAAGESTQPVIFAPQDRSQPWGGFVLRTNAAHLDLKQTILWGGGAETNWFQLHPGSGSSHKPQRPMIYLQNGARATLEDCALLDSQGQATHGESSFLQGERLLVQRHVTGGQHNRGAVTMNNSAWIEFPYAGAPFADNDNDGLYLTGGAHAFTNTLFGWALDDALDAGTGVAGSVQVHNCWFEHTYHEGMAWSDDRTAVVRDSVVLNCGQGIEAGFGAPKVDAAHLLLAGNLVGARFGDNYAKTFTGFLTVTNSLLLFNQQDIFGRTWAVNAWTNQIDRMAVTGNFLSQSLPEFGTNTLWDPVVDAPRLTEYLQGNAPATVGIGWANSNGPILVSEVPTDGIPLGLSFPSTRPVDAEYRLIGPDALVLETGTVHLAAGQLAGRIQLQATLPPNTLHRIEWVNVTGATLSGSAILWLWQAPRADPLGVVPFNGGRSLVWLRPEPVLEKAAGLGEPWIPLPDIKPPVALETLGEGYYRLR